MDLRAAYQTRRLSLLSSAVELRHAVGLEIGACDLPTVPRNLGECRFADFRSAEEMIDMWGLPPQSVCKVDYVLSRTQLIHEQIPDRFDYLVACHVLEHVPDVITYLNSLATLLKPGSGKIILITLPDKRATLDATRPSTTIERLLGAYHQKLRQPTFEQILEFHRHWVGYANTSAPLPLREAYAYAKSAVRSPAADAHCHVWQDEEFVSQIEELIDAGFLSGVMVRAYEKFVIGTNEFAVILETR